MDEEHEDEEEFDTWGTDDVICPHCGYVFTESGEFEADSANCFSVDCYGCGSTFDCEREYTVTYTSSKRKP